MNHPSFRKFRLLMLVGVIAFAAIFTTAVYLLWNGVLTDVLGVKAITFWQALGILVLSKLLFGGFPGRGGRSFSWRDKMMFRHFESLPPEQREHLREEMRSRFGNWASMDAEQRERLREEMRRRFGDWPHPPWCGPDRTETKEPGKDPNG